MDCFTLFRKSRCACVKMEDIGHRPSMDIADRCAILPHERKIHALVELLTPLNRPNPEKSPR
jgi:hypothetical protein